MVDTFDLIQRYTGISKYSKSEVITPQNIVKDMVDLLPQDVFNPDATFFDPAVKSGRFLIEIYNRLMTSPLLAHIPEQDRHNHIIEKQLYGFATSPTAAIVVRKALYNDPLVTGNIRFTSGKVTKESVQGAFNNMKFDVVIGNPPYNKGMDLDFVNLGFDLSKQYTVMITPAKWQTAEANQRVVSEMTYGEFRKKLVPHMSKVVFFPCCKDVFDIYQVDGVTYYLLDKAVHDKVKIVNRCIDIAAFNGEVERSIIQGESLVNIGNEIIEYMGNYAKWEFPIYEHTFRYQVYTPNQAGSFNWYQTNEPRYVLAKSHLIDTQVGEKKESDASDMTFTSEIKSECESFLSWLNTRFVRFFVAIYQSKLTGMLTDHVFRFVPAPPSGKFDHIYTDQELYDAFNLPQKYRDVIEAVIKERK